MRAIAFAVSLAAVFAIPAAAEEDPRRAADLMIEAGRYGVMLDQVERSLQMPKRYPPQPALDEDLGQRLYVSQELRAAVLRYNAAQFDVCRLRIVDAQLCAGPYLPGWLAEPADADVALNVLEARTRAAGERILPLWDALCTLAIESTGDESFCAIE